MTIQYPSPSSIYSSPSVSVRPATNTQPTPSEPGSWEGVRLLNASRTPIDSSQLKELTQAEDTLPLVRKRQFPQTGNRYLDKAGPKVSALVEYGPQTLLDATATAFRTGFAGGALGLLGSALVLGGLKMMKILVHTQHRGFFMVLSAATALLCGSLGATGGFCFSLWRTLRSLHHKSPKSDRLPN
jgi:hypothetical protein